MIAESQPGITENQLTERVRQEIREMLRTGELAPGERLNEISLAQRLQIGRNVVREALRTLEYAGLVRIVPNRGAEVRKLSMEEALNLYDLRAGLARTAGRSAARRASRKEIEVLTALQDELALVIQTGDSLHYSQINSVFHDTIFDAARNPRLRIMNAAVTDELSLFLANTHYGPQAIEQSWREHQKILDTIRASDPEGAAGMFERHILEGKQRLVEGQVVLNP